ncbi:MAG: RNA methyltransferase [Acidobacteriaceae bacterium]|nr:RNA methyltransferase [Acidobacteriaceae bacterium]
MNPDHLRVVLVETRNPLNIGAAARAISNFGFSRLRLVNAYRVAVDEARSAVNAGEILLNAENFNSLEDAIADCGLVVGTTSVGHRELQHTLHRLEYAGTLLRQGLSSQPVALLFGSEKFGLSNQHLSYCHWLLRIGTRAEHGSMNLGQAVAVCLYELARKDDFHATETPMASKSEDMDRLTSLLLDVLERSGYIHSASTIEKTRRLVRRLNIPAHDAEVWLGIFRQVLWKLNSNRDMLDSK